MPETTVTEHQGRENRAIGQVRERLQLKFSNRSRDDVAGAVDGAVKGFVSARIRDFVPILVERIARDELDHRFAAHGHSR